MGHRLDAFILKGAFDGGQADAFDLRRVALPSDLTMFPVIDVYIDYWAERLGEHGAHARPLYNPLVIHRMMRAIARDPFFAVVHTDYFGGVGEQCAAVYRGEQTLLDPSGPGADINHALRLLGVVRTQGEDEFDTVGLGQYRDSYDFFGDRYDGPRQS